MVGISSMASDSSSPTSWMISWSLSAPIAFITITTLMSSLWVRSMGDRVRDRWKWP